ncbi:type VI secretion system-associated protein TagF [Inquilinus sp. Marseille-Q2685]|uniref:type VI secretion system-associated protein TagF n=1 Tax=Inquilinus sp. Marseille-Q2685 TaxID=2866581 RepID=UPI001CE3EA93|nr:type VI secretion system-associated protein TagF [Inquilinus sp. Marseille-Q2685]
MSAGLLIPGAEGPGIFGKLPWLGDFVTRRLPRSFVDPWDDWLQRGMAATRDALGETWLDSFLTAPVWRFLLPAGSAGPAMAGLLMPSVDRVGRYFPLTLASPLEADPGPEAPLRAAAWFDVLERTALAALDDATTPEAWEAAVEALGAPPLTEEEPAEIGEGWRGVPLSSADGLGIAALRLDTAAARARFWTGPAAEGWYLAGDGLPPPQAWPRAFMTARFAMEPAR